MISNDIADSITLIINQSLKSGIFANQLKIAKVTPIYKKDDKKSITNYRPISVLPVVSIIFSSTELAALELIDRLLAQLKNHKGISI